MLRRRDRGSTKRGWAALLPLAPKALAALPSDAVRAYLSGLGRRLSALRAGEAILPDAAERRLARRVLRAIEGDWDDGDENLVRGFLDRWRPPDEAPGQQAAAILAALEAVSSCEPRPQTVRFLLWAVESDLARAARAAAWLRRAGPTLLESAQPARLPPGGGDAQENPGRRRRREHPKPRAHDSRAAGLRRDHGRKR